MHILAILAISKAIQYIYTDFCISCFVPSLCVNVFLFSIEQLNYFNWTIELLLLEKLNHCLSSLC